MSVRTPLQQFRSKLAKLKKQGLVTNVDARSAYPAQRVNGVYLKNVVAKYDDVTSGKVTAVKVKPTELKKYKKAGFDTARGRVLFPHAANVKVRNIGGKITAVNPRGLQTITLPIKYNDLEQWLEDNRKVSKKIDTMKQRHEYFAFTLNGNGSRGIFQNANSMLRELQSYKSVNEAIDDEDEDAQDEFYDILEIIRIVRPSSWQTYSERRALRKATYSAKRAKKFRQSLKDHPAKLDEYNEAAAERMKAYRARLKGSQKEQYKEAAKKRADASHAKRAELRRKKRKRAKKKGDKNKRGRS